MDRMKKSPPIQSVYNLHDLIYKAGSGKAVKMLIM